MTFPLSSPIVKSQFKAPALNVTVLLSSLAVVLVLAILIHLDSMAPGLSPEELASRLSAIP